MPEIDGGIVVGILSYQDGETVPAVGAAVREGLHRLPAMPRRIVVADCGSTDDTLDRARVRASVIGLPSPRGNSFDRARAMEIFLGAAARHPEQDSVTLIEDYEAQRAMQTVVEREKRRERAEVD